ncbi:hypothetical protein Bca52824_084888 [Brassica carinata]|uniref:Uncharacterized protein n=1 Tax=Brassica carinata TaxID=52824 RepID=A0A8X7PPG3_BRACI|nr:hypothetical protein Bca52824_084888 [Brassica carinata]
METGLTILKMSFFLGLVVVVSCSQAFAPWNPSMRMRPGTCDHYECPTYKLVQAGHGYEIRMYNSAVWMSTDPITAPSMTQGTKTDKDEHDMTAPVITQITPGAEVYMYTSWKPTYVATRQFSGYVTDDLAIKEAIALMDSLKSTEWKSHIEKSKGERPDYLVADYNPPFDM